LTTGFLDPRSRSGSTLFDLDQYRALIIISNPFISTKYSVFAAGENGSSIKLVGGGCKNTAQVLNAVYTVLLFILSYCHGLLSLSIAQHLINKCLATAIIAILRLFELPLQTRVNISLAHENLSDNQAA